MEQADGWHPYIEFGNRLLTFVVGVVAVATAVAVWRLGRRRLRLLGVLPLLGVVAQAGLGGVTVLTSLHPVTVAAHFLLSMLLVAASTVLLLRAAEGDGAPQALVPAVVSRLVAALAVVAAAVLVLGTMVTGSGPHSGDATSPARLGLDPRTVSWLHADLVLLFVGLLVGLFVALRLADAPASALRRATLLLVVTVAQAGIGYVQYATDLPEPLVAAHMLGASLLVVAVTGVVMSLRERPVDDGTDAAPGQDGAPERLSASGQVVVDTSERRRPERIGRRGVSSAR